MSERIKVVGNAAPWISFVPTIATVISLSSVLRMQRMRDVRIVSLRRMLCIVLFNIENEVKLMTRGAFMEIYWKNGVGI